MRLLVVLFYYDMLAMCTPFDENSVPRVKSMGFDVLKIASCSFTDWPLLEEIAKHDLPIIASTAGCSIEEVDNVVLFFRKRRNCHKDQRHHLTF